MSRPVEYVRPSRAQRSCHEVVRGCQRELENDHGTDRERQPAKETQRSHRRIVTKDQDSGRDVEDDDEEQTFVFRPRRKPGAQAGESPPSGVLWSCAGDQPERDRREHEGRERNVSVLIRRKSDKERRGEQHQSGNQADCFPAEP